MFKLVLESFCALCHSNLGIRQEVTPSSTAYLPEGCSSILYTSNKKNFIFLNSPQVFPTEKSSDFILTNGTAL